MAEICSPSGERRKLVTAESSLGKQGPKRGYFHEQLAWKRKAPAWLNDWNGGRECGLPFQGFRWEIKVEIKEYL